MTDKPDLLTVYSGRVCIGFLLRRVRHGVEAFDRDSHSLGVFPDQQTAAAAAITAPSTVVLVGRQISDHPDDRRDADVVTEAARIWVRESVGGVQ